jgi:hypothetical protein
MNGHDIIRWCFADPALAAGFAKIRRTLKVSASRDRAIRERGFSAPPAAMMAPVS